MGASSHACFILHLIFRIVVRLLLLLLLLLPLVLLLMLLLGLRLRLHLRHVPCLLRILILLSEMSPKSPKQKTPGLNRAISHRSGTPVWPRREREAFTICTSVVKKKAGSSLDVHSSYIFHFC